MKKLNTTSILLGLFMLSCMPPIAIHQSADTLGKKKMEAGAGNIGGDFYWLNHAKDISTYPNEDHYSEGVAVDDKGNYLYKEEKQAYTDISYLLFLRYGLAESLDIEVSNFNGVGFGAGIKYNFMASGTPRVNGLFLSLTSKVSGTIPIYIESYLSFSPGLIMSYRFDKDISIYSSYNLYANYGKTFIMRDYQSRTYGYDYKNSVDVKLATVQLTGFAGSVTLGFDMCVDNLQTNDLCFYPEMSFKKFYPINPKKDMRSIPDKEFVIVIGSGLKF